MTGIGCGHSFGSFRCGRPSPSPTLPARGRVFRSSLWQANTPTCTLPLAGRG
ncbi:hypothetical protein [Devosia sp. DBB001]|nr:hypothetical protein [Devosia sp. DBB001]